MVTKISAIIESLKSLTLLEATELVKEIEKIFDVSASTQVSVSTPINLETAPSTVSQASEEKTSFDVVLIDVPADKKIAILKVVRTVTGLGLKESKDIVDNIPKTVKEGATKDESQTIKKDLEAAGAKVEIK
eukprot:gene10564-11501_t